MRTETQSRPIPMSALLPLTIDGYDFDAETQRARDLVKDVTIAGHSLNRASAQVRVSEEPPEWEKLRGDYRNQVLPNTLDPDSPVVELGWPTSGHYLMSS